MEPENRAVIDVESEPIDSFDSPEESEIEEVWYSAQQIQSLLKLSKPGLQQSISKLQSIYGLDITTLRRGAARATQYSELALKACKLLNAGKLSELRKLVEATPTAPAATASTAIVFLEQHQQIAVNASTVADNNLTEIAAIKSGLLNNYRQLGRALGRQAAAEVRMGFTEEVKASLADLQES